VAIYDSLFISAGRKGWDLAEPGKYTLQLALHLEGEDIVSNPLPLRVALHARVALGRVLMQDYKQLAAERVNGHESLVVKRARLNLRPQNSSSRPPCMTNRRKRRSRWDILTTSGLRTASAIAWPANTH
jgi:hypothetical protein